MKLRHLFRVVLVAAVAVLTAVPWTVNEASAAGKTTRQQRLISFMAGCKKILDANPNEKYIMTDLNGNGFPELWISYNVGRHADYCWHVYHSESGKPHEVYTCPYGPISDYGNYVLVGNDNGDALRLRYDGNRIRSSRVYDKRIGNEAVTTRNRSRFLDYL